MHRIDYRLKKGWFESIHHGVYRVGPVEPPHYREMAGVLYCGADSVLSHHSAGALWELLPPPGPTTPVAVSTTRNLRGRGSVVRIYRVADLGADEVTHLDGLPLTVPARTLLDLAESLGTRELELLLARYPRRRGRKRLRVLLTSPADPALTRSEAQERFLALVRKGRLRRPETNVVIRGFEVDALWRAERIVVEIDGFAFHSSSDAFEWDRQRDGVLTAAGLRVMRVTWRQITREPEALLVRLAQALATSGAP